MAIPALLAALGGSGGGAAAMGARAAAGASGSAARSVGTQAAQGASTRTAANASSTQGKVDAFNALFGDKPANPAPGPSNEHGAPPKGSSIQQLFDGVKKADAAMSQFADRFSKVSEGVQNAAHNRFLPILEQILPESFGKLVNAVAGMVTAFIDRGKELKNYSPELATADAIVKMRDTMADIREANEIGGNTARMTLSADQIWNDIRDILLPLKRYVTGGLANVLENIEAFIAFVKPPVLVIQETLATMLTVINETANLEFTKAKKAIEALPERIAKAMKQEKDENMMEDFIRRMMQMDFRPLGNNAPAPANPQAGLNVPLFQGA